VIVKWFLIMFVANQIPGQTDPWFHASVMRKSFVSYKSCMHEALTNSDVSYNNAGAPDASIVPGVLCLKGFEKVSKRTPR
jgi:hypothetical protein